MEKLRFFACGCEAGGGRTISDAASRRPVGVLGGEAREEKLEERREDLGEEEGSEAEAGESQTLIRGEEASVLRRTSSVLICDGWRIGKYVEAENILDICLRELTGSVTKMSSQCHLVQATEQSLVSAW